jgi:hypothetical protein
MARYQKILESGSKKFVMLSETRLVTEKDCEKTEWEELRLDYLEITNPLYRAVISIKNAILHQQRLVFCMTRGNTRKLITEDQNWAKAGLDNNSWNRLIKLMIQSKIVEVIQPGTERIPNIYKVIEKDLRNSIQADEQEQIKECQDFVNNGQKRSKKEINKSADQPLQTNKQTENMNRIEYDYNNKSNYSDMEELVELFTEFDDLDDHEEKIRILINRPFLYRLPDFSYETLTEEYVATMHSVIKEKFLASLKEFQLLLSGTTKKDIAGSVKKVLSLIEFTGKAIDPQAYRELVNQRFYNDKFITLKNSYLSAIDIAYDKYIELYDDHMRHKEKQVESDQMSGPDLFSQLISR